MILVLAQQLAPDVVLETRLDEDTLTVRHIACVTRAARSRGDLHAAVERARIVLANAPEEVSDVEIRVDEVSAMAIKRARDRRRPR